MPSNMTMIISPSFGRCLFDAVPKIDHALNVTITQHPVQTGSAVADHAFIEPDEVSIDIGMSDVAISLNTIAGGARNRSVTAYEMLRSIAHGREMVQLVTRLHTYHNLMVTSVTTQDDYKTMKALQANISFQEVRIVGVSIISIQQTCASSKLIYEKPETDSGGMGGYDFEGDFGLSDFGMDDFITANYIEPSISSSVGTQSIGNVSSSSSTSAGSNTSALKDLFNSFTSLF